MVSLLSINPVAFSLGALEIRWYGIIIALGIVLAFVVVQKEMVKRGMHSDFLTDLLVWAVPISIISARIYYVIFSWDYYKEHPGQIIQIWEGGIAIHGALIGAFVTTYIYTKRHGVSFWKTVDIAAAGLLIGQIIGRWGNFMNQEAHGGPVSEKFLETTIIPNWIMTQMTIDGVTYHPTFLYESLWNIIGLIIIIILRRGKLKRGETFLFYLIWYSVGRFFIEGMRTDSLYVVGELRAAQLVSFATIVFAIIVFIVRRYIKKIEITYQDI
ncbi:prolipoprotein diacylglyceryl transferase [Sporosarcina pasteurii]|uniref:Phosphatidylglycerol--prolipoprotein diacylglyceryl transferase n=1 Tax=Sporosarcina pasteurii TaxID=1474 RepID=A0A380BN49_SPOPA|nr:prolipoprotein diacylglyceryl transferase [Sporosarcina pasteurii]MDS9470879.1 prolipoprotein diacylglyceryl transferase [Sporosarcina pasteurii]QBQ05458.1 prolipoprotein diacylglyceryl transferase [Sporosarcina pasteurii]SUJ03125.1 Prolipoprotein diacylglyceryl transferase [Sporosarcina pasteurii]